MARNPGLDEAVPLFAAQDSGRDSGDDSYCLTIRELGETTDEETNCVASWILEAAEPER